MVVLSSRIALLVLTALSMASACCFAASWPVIQTYPQVSANPIIADYSRQYHVTVTISDNDGYDDIAEIRVLFGYSEADGDASKGRGYLAWGQSDSLISRFGGTWTLQNATGGGRWGYMTDNWGATYYINPTLCSTTTSGSASGAQGSRTATWVFRAKPAWAMNPLISDCDVWAADATGNIIGWRDNPTEFDVVGSTCTNYCSTPSAPVVSNPTASSIDVAIAPADSGTDLFCIRVAPAVLGKDFVQANGTLGGTAFFQNKAAWGTIAVTGLASGTTYSFKARAERTTYGYCPSEWGQTASASTALLGRTISYSGPGVIINRGVTGMDAQTKSVSAQARADSLAVSLNTSMRFGGDGYNWKTRTAQWKSASQSTLQLLREARDRGSYLMMCTNTRGLGTGNGSTWVYTDQTPAAVAALTGDWVYYCNNLVQGKRQGEPLDSRGQALLDSLSWGADSKLLAPGEAPVPRVDYWEIGNEPEGPFPPPALTPEDYALRYKAVTQAVIAEDPDVQLGPNMMSADNGNAWLDAVLSDPANRVDFVSYHPYGPLYYITKTTSGGVLHPDDLSAGLNRIKQQQTDRRQKVIDRLSANGRPLTTPLIASEWNPSSWEGTYYFGLNRTAAHGLGIAETIFSFAELGFLSAQYWEYPNYPSNNSVESPGQKVFKALQEDIGDRLLDSFAEPDFRLYTTLDSRTGRVVVWAINMSQYLDKTVALEVPGDTSGLSISRRVLADTTGPTSLITKNSTTEPIKWTTTDLTGSVAPSGFAVTFPRATLTTLVLDRPLKLLPDGTPVTITGRAVTAAHPADGYLYVEQDDRTYGLRVAGNCAGVAVGDRVDIAGAMATLKPDGTTASERYLAASSLTRVSPGTPLQPLGTICRAVGGGPANGTVGVNDAFGLNNIGLLVKIAGAVIEIADSERMYVGDGSCSSGEPGHTGVLVRCPSTAPYSAGDVLTVTGVVEGSVPAGWSSNRRYIRARTADDIVLLLDR